MKISFEQDASLSADQIEVLVRAADTNPDVLDLLAQLNQLNKQAHTLPITVDDQVIVIPISEIVAIEVLSEQLTIHTLHREYLTRGHLKDVVEKLDPVTFVRISRCAVLNLDQLNLLEPEFSGNLLAKMKTGLSLTVSRKYVSELKKALGM
ncbi:LytTR family DNA-binding domain-containing protein [Lacticaseibacillus saniviri]